MSTLLIDELFDTVEFVQDIHILRSTQVDSIRVWIYKEGTLATGSLRLRIYDGATIVEQISIPYADLNAGIPGPYAHGYVRFDVGPLALNVNENETDRTYTFKIDMVGYVNDANNYIAVVREWDGPKYAPYTAAPFNDSEEACGLEIYSYRGQ
jgi:hypothetical protein